MGAYKDKTMDHAFSNLNREWKYMVRLAIKIREGRYCFKQEIEYRNLFTGIYKRLLEDPLAELYKERDGDMHRYQENRIYG